MINQDNYYRFIRIVTKLNTDNLRELSDLIDYELDIRDLEDDFDLYNDYEMYE